ncbi:MAG: hypothetical protein RMJ98_09880 [Myxococcales bacterium]|nr:hypothetical protein [Polyangiaceae bacterium]MDW8249598.1 hypothetical protein [Myxococcales bacterium]
MCDHQGDLDLSGTWLIKARLEVDLKSREGALVQVCPAQQTGVSELLLLGHFEQEGTELPKLGLTICDFSLPEVTAFVGQCTPGEVGPVRAQVTPSEALLAALPGLVISNGRGKLGGLENGASFEPERFTFALGTKSTTGTMASWKGGGTCDNPQNPMGTGEGCEQDCVTDCGDVLDSDGDKLPGVSMTVCGFSKDEAQGAKCSPEEPDQPGVTLQGKTGINFRVNPMLSGKAENSCLLRGGVDAKIEYNVLGANVRLTGGILTVKLVQEAIPLFDVVATNSQFVALRVDGKYGTPDLGLPADNPQMACQKAISNRNLL